MHSEAFRIAASLWQSGLRCQLTQRCGHCIFIDKMDRGSIRNRNSSAKTNQLGSPQRSVLFLPSSFQPSLPSLLQAAFFVPPASRPSEHATTRLSCNPLLLGGPTLAARRDTIRPRYSHFANPSAIATSGGWIWLTSQDSPAHTIQATRIQITPF